MAMPVSSPCHCCSTAAAIDAAALPAAATNVRPRGARGSCPAIIFCGSAAATAARKLSSRSSRTRAASGELALCGRRAEVEERGIGLAEDALDVLRRHVGELAAPAYVLHVPAIVFIERMEDRVFAAVELERLHPEACAQVEIEGGRRLDPVPVELQLGVAVVDEEVGAHLRGELGRGQMVFHVGEADARRDSGGPGAGGEERRLRHAPADVALEASRGAVGVVDHEVLERVVAHAIAHRVVERDGPFALVAALGMLGGEGCDLGVVAVDEAPGLQVRKQWLVHLSNFISLRTPWKSAPFSSARASTTEKWWQPGAGMLPANTFFQRSPSSAFCLMNSLDSSAPTQLMTGARVAGGRNAGESRNAAASSRRRSTFSQSMSINGRRS